MGFEFKKDQTEISFEKLLLLLRYAVMKYMSIPVPSLSAKISNNKDKI